MMESFDENAVTVASVYKAAHEGDADYLERMRDHARRRGNRRLKAEYEVFVNESGKVEDYTPLCAAAKQGHVTCVKLLLELGADVNFQQKIWNKSTPLMKAAERNHAEVVKVLLKVPAVNVHDVNTAGNTAFMIACSNNGAETASLLLKSGTKINAMNATRYTALILAAEANAVDCVKLLLQHGRGCDQRGRRGDSPHQEKVDIGAKNKFRKNALMMASENGNLGVVKELCKHEDIDVDALSGREATALSLASMKNHRDVVRYLLRDMNASIFSHQKQSPMLLCIDHGFVGILDDLLSAEKDRRPVNGANLPEYPSLTEVRDEDGNTLLLRACRQGQLTVVRNLVNLLEKADELSSALAATNQKPVEVSKHNNSTKFPPPATIVMQNCFILACQGGHLDVLDFLLNKASPDVVARVRDLEGHAMQELMLHYQRQPRRLRTFFVKAPSFSRFDYLFAILPRVFCQLDSPTVVVHECHDELMGKLSFSERRRVEQCSLADDLGDFEKSPDEYQKLPALLYYAVALKKASLHKPLEEDEMKSALEAVEGRLRSPDLMKHSCMTKPLVALAAITSESLRDSLNKWPREFSAGSVAEYRARAFMQGPLSDYIESDLSSFLTTAHVSHLLDASLHKSQRPRLLRGAATESQLSSDLRSNSQSVRYVPANVFYAEGLTKVATLCILCLIMYLYFPGVGYAGPALGTPGEEACGHGLSPPSLPLWVRLCAGLYIVGHFLCLCSAYRVDYLGVISLTLIVASIAITVDPREVLNDPYSLLRGGCHGDCKQGSLCAVAHEGYGVQRIRFYLLSGAILSMFLSIQPYTMLHSQLGQLTIMVARVFWEVRWICGLMSVIILVLLAPFLVLFPHAVMAGKPTPLVHMFSDMCAAAMGNYDTGEWLERGHNGQDFIPVRAFFFYLFIGLENVVLFNLVLARLSASHDEIVKQARGQLAIKQASTLKKYLQYPKNDPLRMLPPPFNLVPTIVWLFVGGLRCLGLASPEAPRRAAGAISDFVLCVGFSPIYACRETSCYLDALEAEGQPRPHDGSYYTSGKRIQWRLYYWVRIMQEAFFTLYHGPPHQYTNVEPGRTTVQEPPVDANCECIASAMLSRNNMVILEKKPIAEGYMLRTINVQSKRARGLKPMPAADTFGSLTLDVVRLNIIAPEETNVQENGEEEEGLSPAQKRFHKRLRDRNTDCYVKVTFGKQMFVSNNFSSSCKDNSKGTEVNFRGALTPTFRVVSNQDWNRAESRVYVEVFDSYLGLFPDVKLGESDINVQQWIADGRFEGGCPLFGCAKDRNGGVEKLGTIQFNARMHFP